VIAVVRARVRNNYHSMTAQNHADASSYAIHIDRTCEYRTHAGDMNFIWVLQLRLILSASVSVACVQATWAWALN